MDPDDIEHHDVNTLTPEQLAAQYPCGCHCNPHNTDGES